MMVAAGAIPNIPLLNAVDFIGKWARNHPDRAYRLAVDIRDKIAQAIF